MEIKVPKSGRGYKGTVIGGFGAKQVIAFALGIACIVVTNLLFAKHIGVMWATTIGIVPCFFCIILLCCSMNGLTARQYIIRLYYRYHYNSDYRPFVTKGNTENES